LYFDELAGAEHYAEVLLRRRRKRGYAEVTSPEWRLLELEAEAEARLRQIRQRLLRVREDRRAEATAPEQFALELAG